ncbi:MAG: hypothetical protein ACTSYA_12270 [Candidatus Kariarchaeaceae archaeon]
MVAERCINCNSSRVYWYCKRCSQLFCLHCISEHYLPIFYCPPCNHQSPDQICATCGTQTETRPIVVRVCESCASKDIVVARDYRQSLPRLVMEAISSLMVSYDEVYSVFHSLMKVFYELEAFRSDHFHAFPSIEEGLVKCKISLDQLIEKALRAIKSQRKDIVLELSTVNFFKDVPLSNLSTADKICQSTTTRIVQLKSNVKKWASIIYHDLNEAIKPIILLREHYKRFEEIVNSFELKPTETVFAVFYDIHVNSTNHDSGYSGKGTLVITNEQISLVKNSKYQRRAPLTEWRLPLSMIEHTQIDTKLSKGVVLKITAQSGWVYLTDRLKKLEVTKEYLDLALNPELSNFDFSKLRRTPVDMNSLLNSIKELKSEVRKKLFGSIREAHSIDNNSTNNHLARLKEEQRNIQSELLELRNQFNRRQILPPEYGVRAQELYQRQNAISEKIHDLESTVRRQIGGQFIKRILEECE